MPVLAAIDATSVVPSLSRAPSTRCLAVLLNTASSNGQESAGIVTTLFNPTARREESN